jgi:hypothetical protein
MARGADKIVFISYRRADTDAVAGRIKDRLARDLPDWQVFMDVDSIGAGVEFRRAIEAALARASVFVALIGPRWLDGRIKAPDDLVRREIAAALARGMRVIPVLVNDARMPPAEELPADIVPLLHRHAIELRHGRFDDDFANFARAIAGEVRKPGKPRGTIRMVASALVGAFAGVAAAVAGLVIHFQVTGASASERIGQDGATLLIPACAVIGAAILLWRASRES